MKKTIQKTLSNVGEALAYVLVQYIVTGAALILVRRAFPSADTLEKIVWWVVPTVITVAYFMLVLRKTTYTDRILVATMAGIACLVLIPLYQNIMKAIPMSVVDRLPIDVIACLFDLWQMPIIRCVLLDMPITVIGCTIAYSVQKQRQYQAMKDSC